MFVSVKFHPNHGRAYTYIYDGDEPIAPGMKCTVETKDGTKAVYVVGVDVAEPDFPCKPIVTVLPDEGEEE